MYDLARIRYVTEHYRDLQGLDRLPFALFLVTWAGYDLGWIRPTGLLSHEWLFIAVSLVIVFGLTVAIGKLYERAFGWISAEPRPEQKASIWEDLPLSISYALTIIFADARPEVSRLGMLIAIAGLWLWWRRREGREHYLVPSIIIAAMSLAPLFDANLYPSATARDVAIKLVAAAGILAIGTSNHLTLVRTLGPLHREEESRA